LTQNYRITRREAIQLTIGGVLSLIAAGCHGIGRPEPHRDALTDQLTIAIDELKLVINRVAKNDNQLTQLTTIVEGIETTAHELLKRQEQFLVQFDDMSRKAKNNTAQLQNVINRHNDNRFALRNQMFNLQDDLYAALVPSQWNEVAKVLYKQASAAAVPTIGGG
jgi:type I site-specific restriction endonuclease